jgi:hypothetical protein
MSLEKLSRSDMQIAVAGIVLIISLLAFPWFSFSFGPITVTDAATGNPDGWLGVLALIAVVAVVADLGLERFRPDVTMPGMPGGHEATRRLLVVVAAACLALKFVLHIHFNYFGWGFYVDVVAAAVLVYSTLEARRRVA